jgi:hypothetical protein
MDSSNEDELTPKPTGQGEEKKKKASALRFEKFRKLNDQELNKLIQSLPAIIRDPVESFSYQSERLIMTYGSITAAGALIPSVYAEYSRRKTHPALYLGIVAAPASNKGVVGYVRVLVSKVHNHYRNETVKVKQAFKMLADKHKQAIKAGTTSTEPEDPGSKVVLIAGDITSAKLIQQLQDNKGIPSIMVEDEIDSIANAMSAEHGHQLSRLLRNIFHHGAISQQLKGGNQHYEIESPFMAMILAGTFNQLKKLIGTVENGLLSRYMLIRVDDGALWQNVAPCTECPSREKQMDRFSEQYFKLWEFFNNRGLEIKLTDEQWDEINEFGREELSIQYNLHHEELSATVKRFPNMAFRICQILTAIRYWEKGGTESFAVCAHDDFDLAMKLIYHSYLCSIDFFKELPGGTKSSKAGARERLLSALPENFTRAQATMVAKGLGIGPRNTDSFLKDLASGGLLLKIRFGEYEKNPDAKSANLQNDEE